ncbi:hypothetical protein B0H12DRAFT_1180374 [Mycena haematopus]|nr:hypothetical protein B0H12DRAFT_1180374 [Mycena haematopus]
MRMECCPRSPGMISHSCFHFHAGQANMRFSDASNISRPVFLVARLLDTGSALPYVAPITLAIHRWEGPMPFSFGTTAQNKRNSALSRKSGRDKKLKFHTWRIWRTAKIPGLPFAETTGSTALARDVFARSICSPAERDLSKQRILTYNDFVRDLPRRFGLENPLLILRDIEKHISIICDEGYTGQIGSRAHDAFQLCAYYGDAVSARQWEAICRESHALYQGKDSEAFRKARGLAAKPQDFRAWSQLGKRNLKGPSKQVLEYSAKTAVPTANETSNASVRVVPTSAAEQGASTSIIQEAGAKTQKLTRGQKKNAKAKAKKAAVMSNLEEISTRSQ